MVMALVVYIRKVKKSESKSQRHCFCSYCRTWLCISVKLKNLKANHNILIREESLIFVVYIL